MCGPLIPLACAELGWGMMGIALECSGCPGWRTSELQERDNHPARWQQAYRAAPPRAGAGGVRLPRLAQLGRMPFGQGQVAALEQCEEFFSKVVSFFPVVKVIHAR